MLDLKMAKFFSLKYTFQNFETRSLAGHFKQNLENNNKNKKQYTEAGTA